MGAVAAVLRSTAIVLQSSFITPESNRMYAAW